MFLKMQILDLLPAGHDSSAAPDSDVSPHCLEILVIDHADVVGLIRKRGKTIAMEIVVVICHRIGKAADNGFGDICNTISISSRIDEQIRLTFVLWLGRSGVACNEVLVVVRSDRVKVHGSRDI